MVHRELVGKARLFVLRHFSKHIPAWMRFHDLEHTLSVTRTALEIGRASGLSAKDMLLVELAALFHDTGYATAYAGHELESAKLARTWLLQQGTTLLEAERVSRMILSTRITHNPRSAAQRVLRDADSAKAGQADFMEKGARLRLELQRELGKEITHMAWLRENLSYLESHRFFTTYGEERFGPQKRLNLEELQRAVDAGKPDTDIVNSPEPFMDRDLSWLAFNARVLQEAQDRDVPLLERLKFVAIHSSNLDEFYRVRVSQLRGLRKLGKRDRSALDVPRGKLLAQINRTALAQQAALGKVYRSELLPGLRRNGIRILEGKELDPAQRAFALSYFKTSVAHLMHPVVLRGATVPFMEDRKLYLVLDLHQRSTGKKRLLLANVPASELGRFVTLPASKGRTDLMYLDDAIRLGAARHFKGWTLKAAHAIKLSRDADLYLEDEFTENVADKVRRSLRKRSTGIPARFLYDGAMPPALLEKVRLVLKLKRSELLEGGRYHNLSDLMDLPVKGHPSLRCPPMPPLRHARLAGPDLFAPVRQGDVLLHFPYHRFDPVVDLLHQAAKDPNVKRIATTLYRVAQASQVCEALVDAARNGKRVEVLLEVQARFDEGNNLLWGAALEQAGAKVIYGLKGYKVHCKLLLIERIERKVLRRYACLSTGNFNERTALTYSDIALLTARKELTDETAAVLDRLMCEQLPLPTHLLITSPYGLRGALERAIDAEIEQARLGRPASILLKVNSLEDRPLIRKLYDADRAGVKVRAIIRGICCLRTQVPGHSKHIKAISIVDRYLEHVRAFVFHNAGNSTLHLASADWMERNLDHRVETAFPVLDPILKAEVLAMLELQWKDHVKARVLDRDQTNAYRRLPRGKAVRAQHDWYTLLRKAGKR